MITIRHNLEYRLRVVVGHFDIDRPDTSACAAGYAGTGSSQPCRHTHKEAHQEHIKNQSVYLDDAAASAMLASKNDGPGLDQADRKRNSAQHRCERKP